MKVGDYILGKAYDPNKENHVRSSFRIVEENEQGFILKRVHAVQLDENPFRLRKDQMNNFNILPVGTQLPLL
jgi:hypothetical protein